MKKIGLVLVSMVCLFANKPKEMVPGYADFRFFMSPDQVKKIISDKKYLANGKTMIEKVENIYSYHYIDQSFVYYDKFTTKFIPFDFHTDIKAIKEVSPLGVYHLTARYAKDFMTITCEAGEGKKEAAWEHKFIFYKYGDTYKLFAVALKYYGGDQMEEFNFLHPYFFKELQTEIHKSYGSSASHTFVTVDKYTVKHYYSFEHNYVHPTDFKIGAQANVAYVKFNNRYANYQVTFMTADYLKEHTIKYLSRREYSDSLTRDEMIQF